MLKICTVYFEGFYTPDYVSKLHKALKRNSSVPFQFICLSDNKDVDADIVLPYNHHSDVKKHWHKLKFFSSQFAYQNPGDEIIIMDIDQIITNNIDDMIGYPVEENEFVTYDTWWPRNININGGFYKFKSGNFDFVWNDFILNPEYWQTHYYNNGDVHFKYYGEQNYVDWKLYEKKIKITKMPGEWLGKYTDNSRDMTEMNKIYSKKFNKDYMILDDINDSLKIVHFNGVNNSIHKFKNKFIKENWI